MSENSQPSRRRYLRSICHNPTSGTVITPRAPLRPLPLIPQVDRIQHQPPRDQSPSNIATNPTNTQLSSEEADQEPPALVQEAPLNLTSPLSEHERIQIELHRTVIVIRDTFRQFHNIIEIYNCPMARNRIIEVIEHEVRHLHHR